jgi:hypothetical protein
LVIKLIVEGRQEALDIVSEFPQSLGENCVMHIVSALLSVHQPCFPQNLQMLRNGTGGERQSVGQGVDTAGTLDEEL